jgi:anti-sigma-K factor RskA
VSGERRGPVPGGDHQDLEAQAVGWALSALDPEEAASFAAHLAGCDRCARVVEETREVMAELGSAVAVPPPPGLRTRVSQLARATEQDPPSGAALRDIRDRRRPADRRPRRTVAAVLAAAAVAAVVGFGVGAVVFRDSRDPAVIQALLDVGPATVTPVADADGREVAAIVAGAEAVRVVSRGIPVNDTSDTTYVLWGLRGGEAQALGTFDVIGDEPEVQTVAGGNADAGFTGYGISLEPGRTAPPAPTDVVATGDVAG